MKLAATPRSHPFPRSILFFVVLYMVSALSIALTRQNFEFLAYFAVQCLIMGLVYWVHTRVGLSRGLLWGLALWGLLHMAGGLLKIPDSWPYDGPHQVLYSWWIFEGKLKYDHVVHAFGFGLTTWLCWQALCSGIQARLGRRLFPTLGLIVLCMAAGMGFGALNEIVEFYATLHLENTNVGGYHNTGWDLVSNLVGCLIAGVGIFLHDS